ncbi:MAG: hypothetical protein A2138_20675 [Deltaproteobacteria bacterium RBG_16_71_12]|nr:MAG: hypothetical protein A2138_20675 [Deltaproteobacteria bacterium RBG_16_71_12]
MPRGPVVLLFLALAVAGAAAPAPSGDVPPARLVYRPGPFVEACPSGEALRSGIVARLALDPFAEPAERVLLVTIEGEQGATGPGSLRRARIELFDAELVPLGERVIESDEGCGELVEAAALAASIALAPERVLAPPLEVPQPEVPPPEVPPPEVPPPEVPREEPPREEPPPEEPPPAAWPFLPADGALLGGVSSSWSAFLGPGLTVGPAASVAARDGLLELRAELATRAGYTSDISTAHGALAATVLPCLHLPLVDLRGGDPIGVHACATGTAGLVWAAGGMFGASPYVGAGGQLGLQWVQRDLAAFRLWTRVEAALFRPIYVDLTGGQLIDRAAPANAAIGVTFEIPVSP